MDLGAPGTAEQELRKTKILLQQKEAELKQAIADIENIAYIASHDLKTPINNIISLAHLINEQYGDAIGTEGAEYINFIHEASYYLSGLVSGIHGYSRAARLPVDSLERVNTTELVEEIATVLKVPANCTFRYNIGVREITVASAALKPILQHLLINAITYNDKEQGEITVSIDENGTHYLFDITDTGEGIAEDDYERIFELFKRLREREKNAENMGVGLAIVKRLVEKMHGTITVKSEMGKGTSFSFSIPKQSV